MVEWHFVMSLVAAFVFFSVGWLYFDAWMLKKSYKDGFKVGGFFLLSISFLVSAVVIDQPVFSQGFLDSELIGLISLYIKLLGYSSVIAGLLIERLQPMPKYTSAKGMGAFGVSGAGLVGFLSPVLAAVAGFLYLRRATVGLEEHMRQMSFAFFVLSASELLSLAHFFRDTSNVMLSQLVAPYGSAWIIEELLLLLAIVLMGRWVFYYLIKRIQTQLFIVFVFVVVGIFLLTTITFTFLLVQRMKDEAMTHLVIDSKILQYAVQAKEDETLSDAQFVGQNLEIIEALKKNDRTKLRQLSESILISKEEAFLVIVSEDGRVVMRGEDPDNVADSLSGDNLVRRALQGESLSTVSVTEGVLAPLVLIRSVVPIGNGAPIGAVIVGTYIDDAFVDGIKSATGLEASVYGRNVRSATTFIDADGKSRWRGIKEEDEVVKKTVLEDGEIYTGEVKILNNGYFAVFSPLMDVENNPVGMLFVGNEQVQVLRTAFYSIQMTFVASVIMMILVIIPAYFVSKYISGQIR